jgi:hypothetical protein
VWIRTLKGEEEENEKNNQMMKKEEEENKKQEAKKVLNSFPFRLGTHNCAGKDIEEEKIGRIRKGRKRRNI